MTMQLVMEELPSVLFMFFCGALASFTMHWMKHDMPALRARRHLLEKKLATADGRNPAPLVEDSEEEQSKEIPAADLPAHKEVTNCRKGKEAKLRVAAEREQPNTSTQPSGMLEASLARFGVNLDSESDVSSVDLAGVEAYAGASCLQKGNAYNMGYMNGGSQTGGSNNSLRDAGVSLQKPSRDDGTLGEEELRQLLGEWPETESEESCSELDIGGMWEDSSDDGAPLEQDRPRLDSCSTASGDASSAKRGRWCKSPPQCGNANAPSWSSDKKWYGRDKKWHSRSSQPRRSKRDMQDDWMVPFEKLMKRPSCLATPPAHEVPLVPPAEKHHSPLSAANALPAGAVCMWSAPSDGRGKSGGLTGHLQDWRKETFTDGQTVFQPVPSATGQPLFTDGSQLYAPVCVMLSPPSPTGALTHESWTQVYGSFVPDSDDEDSDCL